MAIYYFCKKGIEYNNTIIIIEGDFYKLNP